MLWSPSATGHFNSLPALRSGPREALAGEAGSGAVVFNGTGVPATALFPHPKTEVSLVGSLHDFLAASRARDEATLLLARRALNRHADEDPAG